MARETALITGITGQDGSYLAELLLTKGYEVHGIVRRSSNTVRQRIDHLTSDARVYGKSLFLHYAELDDATTVRRLIRRIQPDEVYHLAGQSHVGASFDIPESTCDFIAMGTLRLLEVLRDCEPTPKFLHVSSSEIFGRPIESPQNERTPFRPTTPYGVAKTFATNMVQLYRECFGLFACNAICFNHESPRRGESFVTRKICRAAARISHGLEKQLSLGSVEAPRDWGFAPDFVEMFWGMLQQSAPDDFVLASGIQNRVSDWAEIAFSHVGLNWKEHVVLDDRFLRKSDPENLVGDASLARQRLGWKPSLELKEIVCLMVDAELRAIKLNP